MNICICYMVSWVFNINTILTTACRMIIAGLNHSWNLWCCQLYNFTCPNCWSILVQNFFNVQILIISLISHHFQFQVNIRMSSWGYSHDPPSGPKRVRQNSWLRRSIQCQAEIRWDSSHRCHGKTMGNFRGELLGIPCFSLLGNFMILWQYGHM